jgi:CRP-like cAMP-binding protein
VLLRLPRGGPEQQAVDAGEIDAVVDYANSNVILLPAARRALREAARRAPAASRKAGNEAPIANSVLSVLPHEEYQRLLASLEPVTLKSGEVLHEPGVPIRYVYFPVDCVISLLTMMEGHEPLAVGLVGHEGMVGIPLALGIDVSSARALVQEPGTAMRMESAFFREELLRSKPLQEGLHRYKHALVGQIAQIVACNQFHPVQARLARYLLMTGDRARRKELRLTHEFLADMLGVRRAGITLAALALQKRRLIEYRRGKVTLLDRRGLNALACVCYRIVKGLYDSAAPGSADSR